MSLVKRIGAVDEDEKIPLTDDMLAEEKDILERKKKALDEMLRQECIGKYKIEIMFKHDRSITKPSAGALSIWESGSKLHGGGDAKIYFCPGRDSGNGECEAIIPFDNVNYGHALCPKCGTVWKGEDLKGEILGRWTMQGWADKLVRYFRELGCTADIYVKQPKTDIRQAAQLEQERQMHGDKLGAVRRSVIRYIYPLKRILADTQNGSDLHGRFHAFLKS